MRADHWTHSDPKNNLETHLAVRVKDTDLLVNLLEDSIERLDWIVTALFDEVQNINERFERRKDTMSTSDREHLNALLQMKRYQAKVIRREINRRAIRLGKGDIRKHQAFYDAAHQYLPSDMIEFLDRVVAESKKKADEEKTSILGEGDDQ